jgi:hypothetical protein
LCNLHIFLANIWITKKICEVNKKMNTRTQPVTILVSMQGSSDKRDCGCRDKRRMRTQLKTGRRRSPRTTMRHLRTRDGLPAAVPFASLAESRGDAFSFVPEQKLLLTKAAVAFSALWLAFGFWLLQKQKQIQKPNQRGHRSGILMMMDS